MPKKYDFSGYATKHDIKCTDGRTIKKNAFKHHDGEKVPLVWQHLHNDPTNFLGHAFLEYREDGVYAYGVFNNTENAKHAKELIQHEDISALSIYANQLKQSGGDVLHGVIREVSLVMAGANPGASIDNVGFAHADGSVFEDETEAIITAGSNLSLYEEPKEEIKHEDPKEEDKTVEEVLNSFTDDQRTLFYAVLSQALEHSNNEDDENSNPGGNEMKKNAFDKTKEDKETLAHGAQMSANFNAILADAQESGSFKKAVLAHAGTYGIDDIDFLFPDAKTLSDSPTFISRRMEWVSSVLQKTTKSPFSRIKSMHADITADEARARGYVKGTLKKEEVIKLLKRTTTPTTFYKKQKLDRDDIIDITSFDVVSWLKAEMRVMLDEELARAILVGDGRPHDSGDKIDEEHIRPVWTDVDMYSHHVFLGEPEVGVNKTVQFIESVVRAMEEYKGKGAPTLYVTQKKINDMLLLKDTLGRRLHPTMSELKSALNVSEIVAVPVLADLSRTVSIEAVDTVVNLEGILVNLADYVIGADRGGEISFFDDFDIDYNQLKYLMEGRCSGALKDPKTAIVIERLPVAAPAQG